MQRTMLGSEGFVALASGGLYESAFCKACADYVRPTRTRGLGVYCPACFSDLRPSDEAWFLERDVALGSPIRGTKVG